MPHVPLREGFELCRPCLRFLAEAGDTNKIDFHRCAYPTTGKGTACTWCARRKVTCTGKDNLPTSAYRGINILRYQQEYLQKLIADGGGSNSGGYADTVSIVNARQDFQRSADRLWREVQAWERRYANENTAGRILQSDIGTTWRREFNHAGQTAINLAHNRPPPAPLGNHRTTMLEPSLVTGFENRMMDRFILNTQWRLLRLYFSGGQIRQ